MRPGGLLTLDLGGIVGWAYGHPGDPVPASGSWHLPTDDSLGKRLVAFDNALHDALALHAPADVVAEAPLPPTALSNAATWRQQLSLAGIAEAAAWRHDAWFHEAPASTMRKELIGTGRFPGGDAKDAVMRWCAQQGWSPVDHHAGDALLCWRYAERRLIRRRAA